MVSQSVPVGGTTGDAGVAGWEWTTQAPAGVSLGSFGDRVVATGADGVATAVNIAASGAVSVEAVALPDGEVVEGFRGGLSSLMARAGFDEGPAVAVAVATVEWDGRRREQQQQQQQQQQQGEEEGEVDFADADDGAGGGGGVADLGSGGGGGGVEGLTAPASLLRLVQRLGLPTLDGSIFDGPPASLSAHEAAGGGGSVQAPGGWGRKLLSALHAYAQAGVLVTTYGVGTVAGGDVLEEPLLDFDAWSPSDRQSILLCVLEAHSALALTPAELDKLKALWLFTEVPVGGGGGGGAGKSRAVAISECTGAYWCANMSVLGGLQLGGLDAGLGGGGGGGGGGSSGVGVGEASGGGRENVSAAVAKPVILLHDPLLVPVYTLVGVEELTPTIAVRRFTLPSLLALGGGGRASGGSGGDRDRASGQARLAIMQGLASRWAVCRVSMGHFSATQRPMSALVCPSLSHTTQP